MSINVAVIDDVPVDVGSKKFDEVFKEFPEFIFYNS